MIIGIDEKGTFALDSKEINLFVGAHLLEEVDHQGLADDLTAWKTRHKYLKDRKGEIKGKYIDENLAIDFIQSVIQQRDTFYITACGTIPALHRKNTIQFHRDHHIKGLNKGIREYQKNGKSSLAEQYTHLRNWYRKLNYQLLIKNWALGEMIGNSFLEHVVQTILENKDTTLGTIQIIIDQDFVREPQHIIFWKDILRSHFYSYTYKHPIPILDEWPDDHPFYAAKSTRRDGSSGIFVDSDHVFRDACNFAKSHEQPLVQVADILATIIADYQNTKGQEFKTAYTLLKPYLIPVRRSPITLFRMSSPQEAKPDPTPNPYEILNMEKT